MCRHDVDLVGPPFFQCLRCCHETVHIINDVILRDKETCLKQLINSQHSTCKCSMAPSSVYLLYAVCCMSAAADTPAAASLLRMLIRLLSFVLSLL